VSTVETVIIYAKLANSTASAVGSPIAVQNVCYRRIASQVVRHLHLPMGGGHGKGVADANSGEVNWTVLKYPV